MTAGLVSAEVGPVFVGRCGAALLGRVGEGTGSRGSKIWRGAGLGHHVTIRIEDVNHHGELCRRCNRERT